MVQVRFEPLTHADLPLITTWFNEPLVQQWYAKGLRTPEQVHARYTPNIEGSVPTRCYVIHLDELPIGFIKTYRIQDYPDYARKIEAEDDWAGVDFFVGEAAYRGRGLAKRWLRTFVERVVFRDSEIMACVAGPDPENAASLGALRSAGFQPLRVVAMPDDDPDEALHVFRRPSPAAPTARQ